MPILDYPEDADRQYVCGTAKRWEDPSEWEKEAIDAVSDFDGWLEHLHDDQVKEIVRSLAKTMEEVTTRTAEEWER